jgi:hypothetical protein
MKALGWLIAVSALLITVPRYTAVFAGIDDTYLTALGMGVLLAGGAAYIFHAWARTKRTDAWKLLAAFGVNLAYEPIIITPFILARLWGLDLAGAMSRGYAVFWSLVVATAPVVLVGGVVLAVSFQRSQSGRKAKGESAKRRKGNYKCDVAGCDFVARSQNGLNAHKRRHKP